MTLRLSTFAACTLLLAAAPAFSGPVEVKFTDAERFSDAGTTRWDERHNLDALAAVFKELGGRYLPADQTLSIEVLDVDLAGEARPTRRGDWIRVARGMADWPRITVRYSVQGPQGDTVRQGEARISDPSYLQRGWSFRDSEPLRYERRMLEEWFRTSFTQNQARAGG